MYQGPAGDHRTVRGESPVPAAASASAPALTSVPAPVPPALASIPVPASALVGRAAELTALNRELARAAGPAVVAVTGDPGIGKTRLLAELTAEARRAGRTVLAGWATEFERDVPFGMFRNLLDDHLGAGDHPLTGLAAGELRLLPAVFPGLADPGGAEDPGLVAGERYRLHRAVRALLENIAGDAGLVLVLDDLHWADEGSVELLDHLLRHPPRAAVLLAVAYRPRQASARLDHAMESAVQRGLATVLKVGPLTAAEADGLLPAGLGPTRREQLYQASGGNPFYLEILARHRPGGEPVGQLAAGEPVRAALAADFATLTRPRQRLVHAAAVAGDEFDAGLLAAVAEFPEPDVLAALDELVSRDLLRPSGVTGRFRFRHPLLRSAAYQHAGAGWRLAAHERAAAELGRRGASPAERARHIEASAAVGDRAAVELLRAAAQDAMHATPAAAAAWLGSALRLLPGDPGSTDTRLQLLNLRARALGVTGRLSESRDLLSEILRLLPAGGAERGTVVQFLTMLEQLLGNHAQAKALLQQELRSLPDPDGPGAAALRVGLALTGVMYGPPDHDSLAQAIAVARGAGDRTLLGSALSVGVVLSQSFDVTGEQTAGWLDEAVQLVDAMSDDELAQRLDTALFVGWGELYLERFGAAARHLRRALRMARRTGQSHLLAPLHTVLGVVGCTTGRLPQATEALDDALESAVLTGGPEARARVLGYRCWASVWTGDLTEALAAGTEAVALAAAGDSPDWQAGPAEAMLGFARYAAGDPNAALEHLLRAGHGQPVRPVWQARWYEWLAAAAAASGDHRAAVNWADQARRLPVAEGLPRRAGFVHLAQVHATLRDDPAIAAGHAARAATSFDRAGDRLGAAQSRLYAAAAYQTLGAPADREAELARRALAACGAHPTWLARRIGVPLTAPTGATGPAGYRLTPRELSVLRLLAEALTAAAIARRLGISTGTVHKHLAQLYRKLGTADRLATVLRAREAGLLPDTSETPAPTR